MFSALASGPMKLTTYLGKRDGDVAPSWLLGALLTTQRRADCSVPSWLLGVLPLHDIHWPLCVVWELDIAVAVSCSHYLLSLGQSAPSRPRHPGRSIPSGLLDVLLAA